MPPEQISGKSFIEVQFPVSKISKESYKERTAAQSQTLTPLGKWWGRKPLILCRGAILGLLLPATDDPIKDREIFLKLLTMDDDGLWHRKSKNISINDLAAFLTSTEQINWFKPGSVNGARKYKSGISKEQKEQLQKIVLSRMGYDNKIKYCVRPEQIDGPSPKSWKEINNHLGTHASSFPELIQELGKYKFGSIPSIGDCYSGGGNIPFEAARLGCNVFASDLNPIATLLTWASLNIAGGTEKIVSDVRRAQKKAFEAVDKQITEWGIEHNEKGWRAYAYLYCNEVICPECGWKIPLLPTLSIAERMQKVHSKLVPDPINKCFNIQVISGATQEELEIAKKSGTIDANSRLICPNPECTAHNAPLSLEFIRGEDLRKWEKEEIIPRKNDVFKERLYAIRWEERYPDENGKEKIRWHFCAPTDYDILNEKKATALLIERYANWQEKGFLPELNIESGYNTDQIIRERGWRYWHQLFTPRQLLTNGLFLKEIIENKWLLHEKIGLLLSFNRTLDNNSKLCRWHSSIDKSEQTFYNQALNTLYLFSGRGCNYISSGWFFDVNYFDITSNTMVIPQDSRLIQSFNHIWITDPPYADAINYHELSEFFLAWDGKIIQQLFPDWYFDSKRAIAIRGSGVEFKKGMIDSYLNLTKNMPENGSQIIMFTHQSAAVWADVALIIWASGLQVTAAWCIATETDTAMRKGNYVQGTVLLILRKQSSEKTAFLDEIYPEVESEVKRQLDTMLAIDDKDDPNFSDTDYQLAAYAAALRVLTKYKKIEEIDIEREIARVRQNGEKSPLEVVIENAVKIACDHLVPIGIDSFLWKQLGPEERFYLKGLELESHGEYRNGAYQELARGFGLRSYRDMQESGRANETRLRTASEFRDRFLREEGFANSLVRQILFAIRQTRLENDTAAGKAWLRGVPNYWDRRKDIIGILMYLATIGLSDTMPQWHEDAKAARLLAGAVEQDHV